MQELRSWEEALARAAEEQREQEEQLRRREQELAEREIDIVERELNIIIHQVYQEKPSVKKRKGHFKKSRLLKLGRDSNCISLPSGGWRAQLQLLWLPGRLRLRLQPFAAVSFSVISAFFTSAKKDAMAGVYMFVSKITWELFPVWLC